LTFAVPPGTCDEVPGGRPGRCVGGGRASGARHPGGGHQPHRGRAGRGGSARLCGRGARSRARTGPG